MRFTRKDFLVMASAGAIGAALAPGALLAGSSTLSATQLQSSVGETFRLRRPDGRTVDLVLVKFTERPSKTTNQFTLSFDAPGGERLREGTYPASGKSGSLSVFLVPTGFSGGHAYYRADFNLLVPKQ